MCRLKYLSIEIYVGSAANYQAYFFSVIGFSRDLPYDDLASPCKLLHQHRAVKAPTSISDLFVHDRTTLTAVAVLRDRRILQASALYAEIWLLCQATDTPS